MPGFRYRALTQAGEVVSGSISAPTAVEVTRRIEYLGLVPIETIAEDAGTGGSGFNITLGRRARSEEITVFTLDLALLLKSGTRIEDGLDLLANDVDIGGLRPTIAKVHASVRSGESFGDAIARFPKLFPSMYVALVRVGEASNTLDYILEVLANERSRSEALRRKLSDALRYPAFLLLASLCVLLFFLFFVLPQFATVLRDFGAKLDPIVLAFIGLSDFLRENVTSIAAGVAIAMIAMILLMRRPGVRRAWLTALARLPVVRLVLNYYRTALFCRNLGVLLSSGVALPTTLRILADMMATTSDPAVWLQTVDRVRQGGKLSDALADGAVLPPTAVRMLRLGEETGKLPMLAGRVAEFYETKLQRSLDRVAGIAGPTAIIAISIVVGGLIVSVMTSLLSVSQIVG